MKISILMDDANVPQFCSEHGLSLFIETAEHKVLFDMGKSDLFLRNAEIMHIDVADADVAILSHGHYDHGGGLQAFLNRNSVAKIYVHQKAFEGHYARRKSGEIASIGIEQELQQSKQITTTVKEYQIDDTLFLFSALEGNRLRSKSNDVLLIKENGVYKPDPFFHEQNLLIQENGKRVLIAGCAHRGIVNILDKAMEIAGGPMHLVIGGFHLSNPSEGGCEPQDTIDGIAEYLLSFPTEYYTCHCTGMKAFGLLKEKMQNRIHYAQTGMIIIA